MFTLIVEAISGLSHSLIQVLGQILRPQPEPVVIVDTVRLWSVQQEHYWDQRDS